MDSGPTTLVAADEVPICAELPVDVLRMVLMKTDVKTAASAASTSRAFRQALPPGLELADLRIAYQVGMSAKRLWWPPAPSRNAVRQRSTRSGREESVEPRGRPSCADAVMADTMQVGNIADRRLWGDLITCVWDSTITIPAAKGTVYGMNVVYVIVAAWTLALMHPTQRILRACNDVIAIICDTDRDYVRYFTRNALGRKLHTDVNMHSLACNLAHNVTGGELTCDALQYVDPFVLRMVRVLAILTFESSM